MKHYYTHDQRHGILFTMLLLFLFSHASFSQNSEAITPGVFRIKVSEELASQLEQLQLTRDNNNVVLTGISSIDAINRQYTVSGIKRVFRHAGKFEAKHRKYGLHRWYEIEMDKAASVLQALTAYDQLSSVEKAEPVYKKAIIGYSESPSSSAVSTTAAGPRAQASLATLPGTSNDPLLPSQWHYNNTGQTGGTPGADIRLLQAWGIETGTPNVIVAVTDGGIQVNHPDLAANMWVNTGEIPDNNIDDDNNGYVDDINGYGFGDNTGFIAPDAHGTHVGGTVAATTNNGIGVAGVAGGSGVGDGARLMSCAAFGANDNGGFAETYTYAADNGAVISQNSWGYLNPSAFEQAVLDGIDYFIAEAGKDEFGNQVGPMNGGIVIFAAGNDDSNDEWYPGFYDATLAVAATTHEDKRAYYSNYGPWVDISAPGGETINVPQQGILSTITPGAYGFMQGTSMACPHVSGAAALIVSRYGGPGFSPDVLRARLIQTADPIDHLNPEYAGMLGSGRLNAFAALQENDGVAPEPITLSAASSGMRHIILTWIAPADSGNGSATFYDIRYSTSPIDNENFDEATQVSNPPKPQPAGSAETFTITGLTPGTTYFVAIKSSDFFGNESAISNVVSVTTDFPPKIVVEPVGLYDTLLVGETSDHFFAIYNEGAGPLSFSIVNQPDWAITNPADGSIDPGDTVFVGVTFSAIDLSANVYTQNLLVLSNDPTSDSVVAVQLSLWVEPNGAPIISVEPDSLLFGDVFIGNSVSKQVTIHNGGSELLTVMASLNAGDFSTDFPGNFPTDTIGIPPFGDLTFNVSYTPTSVGYVNDILTLQTNDPVRSNVTVWLFGTGVEAPAIDVSPDSLYAVLNTGNTTTQLLTISNNGGSDLEFSIATSAPVAGLASVKEVQLPPKSPAGQSSAVLKQTVSASAGQTQTITLRSVGKFASAVKVLILSPDSDVSDLATMLNGFDDVEASIFPQSLLPGITLNDLVGYDVILTNNNTQWLQAGNVEPEVIGDLLADYIDQGGKVIANSFVYSYDAWKLEGRFIDEQYGPFTPSTTDVDISTSIGTILAPGHPVMQGVNSLQYNGFVQNVGLASGATALANWANGDLLIAANANVVALNLLPSLGNGGPFQWSGDLPTIYQNAIHWLSGPSFISVSPDEGIVSPGTQTIVEVTFDADGLESGLYAASIDISTNVPNNELVSVPAQLQVLGPEFTVDPDSIVAEVEKGGTVTRTLTLSNNGSGDHPFTVSARTTAPAQASLPIVSVTQRQIEGTAPGVAVVSPEKKRRGDKATANLAGTRALENPAGGSTVRRMSVAPLAATTVYATDFESFATGDITGQEDWFGQFGNWTVEQVNPFSGARHFRGLADGLGRSLAFSPNVGIGTEPKSTTSMAIDVTGSGVTWQVIPQSPTAESILTRVQFSPTGTIQALVSDGAGGGTFTNVSASLPSGYFNLTIEADRATGGFTLYIDGAEVFSGQGFAGDIEEVVILSEMEVAGPTLDIDDFEIIDGVKEFSAPFVSVSPASGNLAAGQSIEIDVTFDASELEFGDYFAEVVIDIAGVEQLIVPAQLTVVGNPTVEVSPTVIQAVVAYKEDTVETFQIRNTGGRPINYSMTVIGADIAINSAPVAQKAASKQTDKRIEQKIAEDNQRSANVGTKVSSLEVLRGVALFEERFEGSSFPPAGWSVVDNEGTGLVWGFAAAHGEGNYAGTGEAATVSSDVAGEVEFDTELRTPVIDVSGYKNVALQFNANYQNFANQDFLELDILVAGQSTWQNVLTWNEDHGNLYGTGVSVTVDLDEYLGNATSFQLRWHYYDPATGEWDWYAQVDDIVIMGDANRWLTVQPASGTVPVGSVADIEAHFDAEDVEAGFYVAGILVGSNALNAPLVGVVASMQVLQPANISVTPDSLYQELMIGESATQTITISNSGASPLRFSIDATETTTAVQSGERRAPATVRTSPVPNTLRLDDRAAIRSGDVTKNAAVVQYATTFEEFVEGDINGQHNWAGQWGNWTVESDEPFSGARHFRGLADGLGQSLAFSPEVAIGSDPISSATMMINADNAIGATWQIIPQSVTAELVNTRFAIAPNGSLTALVSDGLGGGFYASVPASLPSGYFEFTIEVERATSVFTIYFDGTAVFTGQGFAGDIEQVVILSLMEASGPVFDIDDLSILDGKPSADWAIVNPESGVVPAGGSTNVEVTFNAQDIEEGVYTKTLNVRSNDPDSPVVQVSITLNAMDNDAPVLGPVSPVAVTETQSAQVTFTATDEDDSVVNVFLLGQPPFVSLIESANGTATYAINPSLGDAGEYVIPVFAQDGRGEFDSAGFVLSVTPYGVVSFSLINAETGEVLQDFEDAVTVDIASPDFLKYAIRANTAPAKVGSVQFRVDGTKTNLENNGPYILSRLVLPLLSKGDHTLKAESFLKANGKGQKGQSATATVTVTNSAAVTGFKVVKTHGSFLMDLTDGSVINTRASGYGSITVLANTNGATCISSVRFELNGKHFFTASLSPYSLTAGLFGLYLPWNPKPGHYVLKATPYSLPLGLGVAGESFTVAFDVVSGNTSAKGKGGSNLREAETEDAVMDEVVSTSEKTTLVISPVPVADRLNVLLKGGQEGEVELVIFSTQGQLLYRGRVDASRLRDSYEIQTGSLNMKEGVYYLQVITPGGERLSEKFLKR